MIHRLRARIATLLFRDIFLEALDHVINPRTGWIWRQSASGGRMIAHAYVEGYRRGRTVGFIEATATMKSLTDHELEVVS